MWKAVCRCSAMSCRRYTTVLAAQYAGSWMMREMSLAGRYASQLWSDKGAIRFARALAARQTHKIKVNWEAAQGTLQQRSIVA